MFAQSHGFPETAQYSRLVYTSQSLSTYKIRSAYHIRSEHGHLWCHLSSTIFQIHHNIRPSHTVDGCNGLWPRTLYTIKDIAVQVASLKIIHDHRQGRRFPPKLGRVQCHFSVPSLLPFPPFLPFSLPFLSFHL